MVTRLTVIAAGFERARRQLQSGVRLPTLERLIARGRSRRRVPPEPTFQSLECWQADVLQALSHDIVASAPVSALGAALIGEGSWLHAQFVHFAAGLDHLVLVPLHGSQALEPTDATALQRDLAAHVREESYEWRTAGARHFLHTTAHLQADTCAPDAATRLSLVDAMPRGASGRTLRRLMTELQMQLHEHPVNRARERAGLLPANGVWLWGLGEQSTAVTNATLPRAFADDDFLCGLYRLHAAECEPLPADGAALVERAAGEAVLLLHCDSLPALDAHWLAPLERVLLAGRIEQLELILDDMHVIATRWHRWRLWRRLRPLAQV